MLKNPNFVEEIEKICREKRVDYIDAVVYYCETHNLEVETAAYWIKRDAVMKGKIQVEAESLNVLKRM